MPWMHPSTMIAHTCGPAIAKGCGFVVRPDSETPLSSLALVVPA
ncbi:aldehyde dehydrogenase family protein [Paracoccus sp. (in: a-proteobacteria)]